MIRILIALCCVVLMTACASTPKKTPARLKQENKALVLGIKRSSLKEFLNLNPGLLLYMMGVDGETTHLHFIGIDGQSCSIWGWKDCQPYSVELPPGNHSLDFECAGYIHAAPFRHTVPGYRLDVKPGHIYQMYAQGSADDCLVGHKDITPNVSRENFHPEIDPRYWKRGDTFEYFGGYFIKFVPTNESAKNWSKSITLQFVPGRQKTALEMINSAQKTLDQQCPGTEFTMLEPGDNTVTYRFNIPVCGGEDAHVGMERIYTGKEGIYKFAYAEKTAALSEATIEECLVLFDKSGIRTEEAPKE